MDPDQPSESAWEFVQELQSELWTGMDWPARPPQAHEANLGGGVSLEMVFEDTEGVLQTATADLRAFLRAAKIAEGGTYRIRFCADPRLVAEAYRVAVTAGQCEVSASTTEGIRRAIFFIEDQMLRASGPFLPLGVTERTPVIRTRISRCYFGPIHRPPKNRDELTDNINYYPDEYLNRLAHEAVNGLWLTIHFREVCRSSILPNADAHLSRRLEKLRATVARCARYGIKIYLFANEPAALLPEDPMAQAYPELLGGRTGWGPHHYFCTSTRIGQDYLEEALFNLFSDVPGLGGLVNITVGEAPTHCYSFGWDGAKSCPRCAQRTPHEVLHDTLAAMERGMHAASPGAELISWPYFQFDIWGDAQTVESAGCNPPGVILQHNFESSGEVEQCGRIHKLQDYWLAWPGPSQLFKDCAQRAGEQGTRMGAKLQVGCSHEVATVPYVPVPGNLYLKYREMHALGVSSVMQCWYFGNYPGVMTRAAGELAFAPLPETQDEFLHALARRDWGDAAGEVVRAWNHFQKAYNFFPLNHVYGWFGPSHDAPVWPLHLEPVDQGISSSWLIALPSGDRIGECFAHTHTLPEVQSLTRQMADEWERGVACLRPLLPACSQNEARRKDIGVAQALGIQFESAANMLEFYALREELPHVPQEAALGMLDRMEGLVLRELERDEELLGLCLADSRLGFHSEAEGYKYFPEKIRWRMRCLDRLIAQDFPRIRRSIREGAALWPEYTGKNPQGPRYHCRKSPQAPTLEGGATGSPWDSLPTESLTFRSSPEGTGPMENRIPAEGCHTSWKMCHTDDCLYFRIECTGGKEAVGDSVQLHIESRRLWPVHSFIIHRDGTATSRCYPAPPLQGWKAVVNQHPAGWSATLQIPFSLLSGQDIFTRPVRFDVERSLQWKDSAITDSWNEHHPLESRLVFATANPKDLGWLLLNPQQTVSTL